MPGFGGVIAGRVEGRVDGLRFDSSRGRSEGLVSGFAKFTSPGLIEGLVDGREVLGLVLGVLGLVLGVLGRVLGVLGRVLGMLGRVLGREVLGRGVALDPVMGSRDRLELLELGREKDERDEVLGRRTLDELRALLLKEEREAERPLLPPPPRRLRA